MGRGVAVDFGRGVAVGFGRGVAVGVGRGVAIGFGVGAAVANGALPGAFVCTGIFAGKGGFTEGSLKIACADGQAAGDFIGASEGSMPSPCMIEAIFESFATMPCMGGVF